MTDREMVMQLLSKIADIQPIYAEGERFVEIANANYGESIVFQFDDQGNLVFIES